MIEDLTPLQITKTLCSTTETGANDTVFAPLFGELVKLACPVLERYHGDLYHDAQWLTLHFSGDESFEFIWAVDESHTFIGENDPEVLELAQKYNGFVYVFSVIHEHDKYGPFPWVLKIRKVK